MEVRNQKQFTINMPKTHPIDGVLSYEDILYDLIVSKMKISQGNQPVTVYGTTEFENNVLMALKQASQDEVNTDAEKYLDEILAEFLEYYERDNLNKFRDILVNQLYLKLNMYKPTLLGIEKSIVSVQDSHIVYTSQDIKDTAKEYIKGSITNEQVFVNFASYTRPEAIGITFKNENEFEDFKQYAIDRVNKDSNIEKKVKEKFNKLSKVTLNDLTETILIRTPNSPDVHPYSFGRCLYSLILEYSNKNNNAVIPFNFFQSIIPTAMVFINMEVTAESSIHEIEKHWKHLIKELKIRPNTLSQSQIKRLKTAEDMRSFSHSKDALLQKRKRVKLKNTKPSQKDLAKIIENKLRKRESYNKTHNVFKHTALTYMKPNRRDPLDTNKPGKTTNHKYKPDIHLYVDTSGSISSNNYKNTVMTIAKVAKKLNVNLYFTSFSTVLSKEVLIITKNKTLNDIMKQLERIRTVTGGTNISIIWSHINQSAIRKSRLNIVITDFDDTVPNTTFTHPKQLYYFPIECDERTYRYVYECAKTWLDDMSHHIPNFRNHMLF